MAQHRRKNRNEQEETEEEKRHKKRANQPKYDRLKAPDEGTVPAADFSVAPSADKHAALLANIPSDEQRAGLVTQLQQSYGNAYVQQVMERIQAGKSPGQPLEQETRSEMEAAFNKDFGDVRVHTDTEANRLSRELGAKAFTSGKDIFFREGAYESSSGAGKSLLGHELTHVLQQKSDSQAGNTIGRVGDALEQEAALAGQAVSEGHPVSVETASATPALQRQAAETEQAEAPAAAEPKEATKEEAIAGVQRAADSISHLERQYVRELVRYAAMCQSLGAGESATKAMNRASETVSEILKSKIEAFDVECAKKEMVASLLNAVADVQRMGGNVEAEEAAMNKAKTWAEKQLTTAINELKGAPSETNARDVLVKAGQLAMLGGDFKLFDAARKDVLSWAEAALADTIKKHKAKPSDESIMEVERMARQVYLLGGDTKEAQYLVMDWKYSPPVEITDISQRR